MNRPDLTGHVTWSVPEGRLTISVPEAGQVLGIGRDAAYAAAKRGQIPTLRLGRSLRVSVPLLMQRLGATPTQNGAEPDAQGSAAATHEVSGGPHDDHDTARRLFSA
jgi:excisionase family DNA binding protein